MIRTETRSNHTDRPAFGRLGEVIRRAGRAAGRRLKGFDQQERAVFEQLETRIVLYGDHPGFTDIFNRPDPLPATVISLNPGGVGSAQGSISPAGDNDVFVFTAPANDFVRVWADTLSLNSTLDSRVEVYVRQGFNHIPIDIVSGSHNNGGNGLPLTGGNFTDGWAGFIAEEGMEYFIVVRSDRMSGFGSVGEYMIRVNARSVHVNLDEITGSNSLEGDITLVGGDRVYRVRSGEGDHFNGLISITATADFNDFDPRLEIYGANGLWITGDSDTGNIVDAFAVLRGQARQADGSDTFYVRIRSDRFGDPLLQPSTGEYILNIQGTALPVTIDPVTRLGSSGTQSVATQADSSLLRFQAQGTGLTFITINVGFPGALPDSAVRLYEVADYNEGDTDIDRRAPLLAFNELPGAFSRLIFPLVGGRHYFVVVENFDGSAGGGFIAEFEAHHTFVANQPVDDHITTPTPFDDFDPTDPEVRRQFELATPIVWSEPMLAPTPRIPGGDTFPIWDIEEDHSMVLMGRATGRIYNAGDRDLFQFVPPIDMLGEYEGEQWPQENPEHPFFGFPIEVPLWHPFMRPATRLQALVQGLTMFNARVRIFDSNFDVIFEYNNNALTGPYGADPAGPLDPASWPPELPVPVYGYTFAGGQPADVELWGGEVYYLEVLSQGGHGRYEIELQVDAYEDFEEMSRFYRNYATAGDWQNAYELWISDVNGASSNFQNVSAAGVPVNIPFTPWWTNPGFGGTANAPNSGNTTLMARAFAMNFDKPIPGPPPGGTVGAGAETHPTNFWGNPGTRGVTLLRMSDLATIETPIDTHLYKFRALYDGVAEIRINTTNLQDGFWEGMVETMDGDPDTDPVPSRIASKTKVYQSPLHSALRIFDNDLQEIAFNAGNGVTGGESNTYNMSIFANRTFYARDARVVFHVEAGKNYFVQVESGQRENFTATFPKVDWRHATGSYELLINTMPQNLGDDHVNIGGNPTNVNATPIPLDLNIKSTTQVLGAVSGRILHTPTNLNDTDLFQFITPGTGTATVSLVTPAGGQFARELRIFDQTGTLRGFASGNGTVISAQFQAVRGDRFWVGVNGLGGAQGEYEVRVSGIPHIDDHSPVPLFSRATEIPRDEYDFTGIVTRQASLEAAGDSDIYSFETIAYDVVSVTIQGVSFSMIPRVRIYEISVDPVGNPILLMIGQGAAATGNNSITIPFSVTAPERRHGATNEVYNTYFVVVSGADPNVHWGDYTLTLNFNVTTDDHPDLGQWDLATPLDPGAAGTWNQSGVIEIMTDTDLFQFTAPARGTATITITSPAGSLLLPRVRIFDDEFNPVVNRFGQFVVTGPDQPVSEAIFSFTALRDRTYFIVVEGAPSVGHTHKTEMTGHYTVHLDALIADDHANEFEWEIATEIVLSRFTGKGLGLGELEIPLDTDLFFFTTLVDGDMPVRVTVPNQVFRPFLRLFDSNRNEIGFAVRDGGPGDETGVQNGIVQRTLHGLQVGEVYYVLVSSDQTQPNRTGNYSVFLDGPLPPRGDDDHANMGEWDDATYINVPGPTIISHLNPQTGSALVTGRIDYLGDSDLLFFTSLAGSVDRPRPAQVYITTPEGSPLDLRVTIFGPDQQMIVTDVQGQPGINAAAEFNIDTTGQKYWILIEHLEENLGDYLIHVQTTPEVFYLYFPEGFASNTIREYVTLVNPNDYEVTYTIRLRYEGDFAETVVADTLTLPAQSRRGVTISDGDKGRAPGVLDRSPYAIVVEADGFIGANISHYDFGSTLGEAFTRRTSDTWTFASANRWPGSVREYALYYNPNPTPVLVHLTAYLADGTIVNQTHYIEGHRRGGWAFDKTTELGVGQFSFTLTSEPANPDDEHFGIVAALSHYNLDFQTGYALLGDPDGGARAGILPGISNGPNAFTTVTFFNPNPTSATLTVSGRYTNTNLPDLGRVFTIGPNSFLSMNGTQLGMVANQTMGMRWTSNVDLSVMSTTRRGGDADAAMAGTQAARTWVFGDAFLNRTHAGTLYFEDLFFYNPHNQDISVTLTFFNNLGEVNSTTINLTARDFGKVSLHELPAALPRVFNWFGIEAKSSMPFVASMTHYDLFLGGGWGTAGAPLGLMTEIWRI